MFLSIIDDIFDLYIFLKILFILVLNKRNTENDVVLLSWLKF